MCWGIRTHSHQEETRRGITQSDSKRHNSKSSSVLSNQRLASKSGLRNVSSPSSTTAQTGGILYNADGTVRPSTSNDCLPVEKTAKSPTNRDSSSHPSRERKNNVRDPDADTWKSGKLTEDETTLRLQESKRDGTAGPETSEATKSEWSVIVDRKAPDRKKKEADRRALEQAIRPSVPPSSIPSIPSIPSPTPARTPPVPSVPRVPPSIIRLPTSFPIATPPFPHPSPSVTPPPSALHVSFIEKTAHTTIQTQRTMMDEETVSKQQSTHQRKNEKDSIQLPIQSEGETRPSSPSNIHFEDRDTSSLDHDSLEENIG